MLTKTELNSLFEVLSDPAKTFEECLQKFHKFTKGDQQFRACCTLCYLLENNVTQNGINSCIVASERAENYSLLHFVRALPQRECDIDTLRSGCIELHSDMRIAHQPRHKSDRGGESIQSGV